MVQARIDGGETVGMMVRMPSSLRDRIKAAADESSRSQNSEIVATLEEKYPPPTDWREEFADLTANVICAEAGERPAALNALNDYLARKKFGMTASYEGGENVVMTLVDPKLRARFLARR